MEKLENAEGALVMSEPLSYYVDGKLLRVEVAPALEILGGGATEDAMLASFDSFPDPVLAAEGFGRSSRIDLPTLRGFSISDVWDLGMSAKSLRRPVLESPKLPARPVAHIPTPSPEEEVFVTDTFIVEEPRRFEVRWLESEYGVEIVNEGGDGSVLFRVPWDRDVVRAVFEIPKSLYERGGVLAAHPNFLSALSDVAPSPADGSAQWNHENPGNPGLAGADVHARAAWTITKGNPDITVAVLDDGVDTAHPALKPAIRAERDFGDDREHAQPDPGDSHGTACAGIIGSRSTAWPGLAPEVGLLAVRIANRVNDKLILDLFNMSNGIKWAWQNGADVLSNSWFVTLPNDSLRLALRRACTRGRKGKGAVVVMAAGNFQVAAPFSATVPGVFAVGASNQWDEPKTKTSRDGESWWGSNYGRAVRLLAPGVQIPTTAPRRPDEDDAYTFKFNGTSAATPHVAAAAALILSVAPDLKSERVREILAATADRLPGWRGLSQKYGRGRLNTYAAVRAARRG